ncbi:leucyl aminopeptidase, partial [Burkholderia pseudomallei]
KTDAGAPALKRVVFSVDPADDKGSKVAAKQAVALANGMDLPRDLGNLPGNVCTPTSLANTAKKIAKDWGLKVDVLGLK